MCVCVCDHFYYQQRYPHRTVNRCGYLLLLINQLLYGCVCVVHIYDDEVCVYVYDCVGESKSVNER